MHEDTKFVWLVVGFVVVCLGLLWVCNQPAPCKAVAYQDLSGAHEGLDCHG
ncbi:hypothetical protein UFOVP219_9 [uncultured Caudovirales phage]|uniref:Uncharacterized protein n=1 Tax=uncultured Caudovirales phage TaxID=2100421 RepID=A0A6J7WKR5_9CAUD|nr:hypothetical protein UFOVP219_9 [uncultured Caudovirales phage]